MRFADVGLLAATLLLTSGQAHAEPATPGSKAGDTYEVTLTRDSSTLGEQGSTSSTHDQHIFIECVLQTSTASSEIEYDLPRTGSEDTSDAWQFPARIFLPVRGLPRLLNETELHVRLQAWLKRAGLSSSACGHWIFTWNAFRIECDPQYVLQTIEALDLTVPDLRDGAMYSDADAATPALMKRTTVQPSGSTYGVDLVLDPAVIRKSRARMDVATAEILRKKLTLDAALSEWAKKDVAGTISISLDVDPSGRVWRRQRVIRFTIKGDTASSETSTITEVLERRRVSQTSS